MNRLLTFGCSLTYGYWLEDNTIKINNNLQRKKPYPIADPSKFAWPSILAKISNLECINLSLPAVSNKYIAHCLYNTEINKSDVVVVHWTYKDRFTILKKTNSLKIYPENPNKLNKLFYSNFYDSYDRLQESIFHIDSCYLFLKNVGCKFYFCNIEEDIKPKIAKFCKTSIEDFRGVQYEKALDNLHPGKEAHRLFAEQLWYDTAHFEL